MDFRNVRKITVPQGDVLKIVDPYKNTIWRRRMFPTVEIFPEEGGSATITPLSGDTLRYGDNFTLSAIPNEGYEFKEWYIPEYGPIHEYLVYSETTDNPIEYTNVINDCVISAFFEKKEPTPTVTGKIKWYENYNEAFPKMKVRYQDPS